MSSDCGQVYYVDDGLYSWLGYVYYGNLFEVSIDPQSNSDAGIYTVTFEAIMFDYPAAPH